jgi:hypothetical protein
MRLNHKVTNSAVLATSLFCGTADFVRCSPKPIVAAKWH